MRLRRPLSEYLQEIIFGGLDGVVTQFAIVAAVAGGSLPSSVLLVLGIANLVAGSFSMGIGEFISRQAHIDHVLGERGREAWEYQCYP